MVETKVLTDTSVFGQIADHQHEQVVFCHDHETGLRAIIGIHNTVLGPALGGTRMWHVHGAARPPRSLDSRSG